jgi:hypothetical protein
VRLDVSLLDLVLLEVGLEFVSDKEVYFTIIYICYSRSKIIAVFEARIKNVF